jgi:hypothetical protein
MSLICSRVSSADAREGGGGSWDMSVDVGKGQECVTDGKTDGSACG